MNPFGDVNGSKGQRTECTFWAQKVRLMAMVLSGPIDGSRSREVARDGQNGDGPPWQHQVKLAWRGYRDEGKPMTRLFSWPAAPKLKQGNNENGHLPGTRRLH